MRLLSNNHFAEIFEPWQGRIVTLTEGWGQNCGDQLIYRATEQLCSEFGVRWQHDVAGAAVVLLFGGGNCGSYYHLERDRRNKAILQSRAANVPCWLLPQSFMAPESNCDGCERCFVRERESMRHCPGAYLAPDLALGYEFNVPNPALEKVGYVLRTDTESVIPPKLRSQLNHGDPAHGGLRGYLQAAARFAHLFTDRLHVAITALAYGRRVTLIEGAYHKQRSMWETWLSDLGCEFLNVDALCALHEANNS